MEVDPNARVELDSYSGAKKKMKVEFVPRADRDFYAYLPEDHDAMKQEFEDFEDYWDYDEAKELKSTVYARLPPRYMFWIRYMTKKYNVSQDYVVTKLIDQVRSTGSFKLG